MILGASYNLFDGYELLEYSIKSIRNNVDYISVVYQKVSNFNNSCDNSLVPFLLDLKQQNLVDELFEYQPDLSQSPHFNEIKKRNIGLSLSRKNNCYHHISMDTDEFYLDEQFKYLKKTIKDNDYDSSACQMITYYKEPIYRLEPKEEYYVPLIYKITEKEYVRRQKFPVLADSTRKIEPGNCRIFTRSEIEMHHMSYVRKDIHSKLKNSSLSIYFNKDTNKLIDYFEQWKYPKKALIAGNPSKFYSIVKTSNVFNIKNKKAMFI